MEIYIIVNKEQCGPYSLEQLSRMDITPDTPIWYEGLEKWVPAGESPIVREIFAHRPSDTASSRTAGNVTFSQIRQQPTGDNATVSATATVRPAKPSTYLVGSILVTFFFNTILGLIAIFFSARVTSLYNEGNVESARHSSETAQLFIILSIVVGLVTIGFYLLLMPAMLV
jgi:hypothetical protein